MKYSINSSGYIVAERDIYSLGGFIPKGSVGAKVANEDQISQDGECWVAGGNMSARPDVRIKDNAYVGNWFASSTALHDDVITELSGNTLIPGTFVSRSPAADIRNNFFAKDSFIGVSMDVFCGPEANTTAFPFRQGLYKVSSAAGTLFADMAAAPIPANSCRGLAALRLGKDTKIYVPVGLRCQVLWGYYNTAGQEAYSGRHTEYAPGLHTISDTVYGIARLHFWKSDGTAMTPAGLLATGAKILGHISGSVTVDIRPESASGQYVMDKSSFLMSTDNFGLVTVQLRFLAGSMYDTTMYTKTDRPDYKLYGTFRGVERLEYTKYLGDSHRTAATRDTYISAYDCPLLRVDTDTYGTSLTSTGDLTLRRCIVPKAEFLNDIINGNTYEDIDFSYANEDLGFTMAGYTRFISSHGQGLYRLKASEGRSNGLVSHKGNLADTARLFQAEKYIPLDGSIMEQGFYGGGNAPYESVKSNSTVRVRTGKPLPTFGLVFPSLPTGYSVRAFTYLDEDFITRSLVTDPTELVTTYPYVVMVFRKDDDSAINVNDFIALNRTLRIIDHTKAPEITGSAYVGAGCTVRGDVQLHGDPYVNRLLDVNMWERGTASRSVGKSWEDSKISTTLGNRFRLMDTFPVEPGGLITCNSGYWVECVFFDSNGIFISSPGWGRTSNYVPAGTAYAGIVIKKATSASESGGLIEESDIPLANVKYLRAFEKRRYITNELDRTSPKDILLGPDMWEQGSAALAVGVAYEGVKIPSSVYIRLKRLVNAGASNTYTKSSSYAFNRYEFDALTKYLSGDGVNYGRALFGSLVRKEPTADTVPADVTAARLVAEFVPTPRIVVPYGSATLFISGPKIRMYDNAVLSRNLNQEGEIILQGDAVMGYDFNSGDCMCSNGHSDAIIKLP